MIQVGANDKEMMKMGEISGPSHPWVLAGCVLVAIVLAYILDGLLDWMRHRKYRR